MTDAILQAIVEVGFNRTFFTRRGREEAARAMAREILTLRERIASAGRVAAMETRDVVAGLNVR